MKLKSSLLQFIVIGMTVSLLASCTRVPQANQSNCNNQQTTQPSYDCDGNSGGGSSRIYYGGSGHRFGSHERSRHSPSKVGRGGFGSFGRGGHAGG